MTEHQFPHRRLDAYRGALALHRESERAAAAMPRGYTDHKNQMRRAAGSMARNIAEGANRWDPRDKAAGYKIALGECGELAATLDMSLGLIEPQHLDHMLAEAGRVGAMLTRLVRTQLRRVGSD